ncbi:MAG: hypothetical protein ACOZF0_02720 [Thermodesulfobacteriota bacterium]
MTLRDVFLRLHISLTRIEEQHREINDPRVRALVAETIRYYFIGGHSLHRLPVTYGMASPEGDQAVAAAVNTFLLVAATQAKRENLTTSEERRLFLETPHLRTLTGVIFGQENDTGHAPLSECPIAEHRFHRPETASSNSRKPNLGVMIKNWLKPTF